LDLAWLSKFSEGMAWGIQKNAAHNMNFGYPLSLVEDFQKFAKQPEYTIYEAKPFIDGISWVYYSLNGALHWSPSTKDGIQTDILFNRIEFSEGKVYSAINLNNHRCLVKHDGDLLSVNGNTIFWEIKPFSEGLAWVEIVRGGGYNLIDEEGNILEELPRGYVPRPFSGGKCIISKGNGYQLRFTDGRTIDFEIPENEVIMQGEAFSGDIIRTGINGKKVKYRRLVGKRLIPLNDKEDITFDEVWPFRGGIALARGVFKRNINSYWFVNTQGEVAFDNLMYGGYAEAMEFSDEVAAVRWDKTEVSLDNMFGGWSYIGTDGERLFTWGRGTKHFFKAEPFKDGVAKVQDQPNSEAYYIDKRGKRVF